MEQTPAELWKQRSIAIAATVKEVASVDEALQYALELCQAAEHSVSTFFSSPFSSSTASSRSLRYMS